MKKLPCLIFFLVSVIGTSQQSPNSESGFADKTTYLVDSIVISELSVYDINLLDSSMILYQKASHDTEKIHALDNICENMMHEYWMKYQRLQHNLIVSALNKGDPNPAVKLSLNRSKAASLNNLGFINGELGNIPRQTALYNQSLVLQREIGNTKGESVSLSNLAYIYEHQGNIEMALSLYAEALKAQEKINFKVGMGYSYNNMAFIYKGQDDFENALLYNRRSLAVRKKTGKKSDIATSLNNIGVIHGDLGNLDSAKIYYNASMPLLIEISDKSGIAMNYNNLGNIFGQQNKLDSALFYYYKSINLEYEIKNKLGICQTLINIGNIHNKRLNTDSSVFYGNEALLIGKELGYGILIRDASLLISKTQKELGNFKKALEMHELYVLLRDSLKNELTLKATIRQQTKYEFEKNQLVKEQEMKEESRKVKEETERRDNLQYLIILVALIALLTFVFSLGKLSVSHLLVEGLIFFTFLLFFEFILVLSDPYIEIWAHGQPMYKLLLNAFLAGVIFPAHAFFERILKKRLVK